MSLDSTAIKAQRSVPPMEPLEVAMERFIHEQNLAHYRRLLAEATPPAKLLEGSDDDRIACPCC
jgi:hypothetical protein